MQVAENRPHLPDELRLRGRGSPASLLFIRPEPIANFDTAIALAYVIPVQFAKTRFDPGRIFSQCLRPRRLH
jgi:hypothetical protein